MTLPALALATALFVLLPQAAHAATLDGGALTWPFALPFGGLLLSIALGPLLFAKFWHHHYGKIALGWSIVALGAIGFVIIGYVIITATSNAVNLTDGLDGLAAGASSMVFGAFTLISFLQFRHPCGSVPIGGCYQVRDPLDVALVAAAAMSG